MATRIKCISSFFLMGYFGCAPVWSQQIPNSYIAQQTTEIIKVDGQEDENSWKKAKWSEVFKDIEGTKKAVYGTRFKIIWDEHYFYLLAEIEDPHVWATLKQKDTVIYYNNDFEIFIDPEGDTHNYYEYEVNALNTIWDLFLSKPYRNKGRVLNDWDFKGLKSAVKIHGTLNNATDIDKGWTLEVAIPWAFVKEEVPRNEFWRMNFSRVHWDFNLDDGHYSRKKDAMGNPLSEYNWVWSPQGVVNMHEPERWGYIYFSTDAVGEESTFKIPEDEHIKWYLYELYRDLKEDKGGNTVWKPINGQLQGKAKTILEKSVTPILEKHAFGMNLSAKSPFTGKKLVIHNDGKFETYNYEQN